MTSINGPYDTILWDWNGTLLNDTHTCIDCMNILLEERGIAPLTRERYLDIFTFPVREYYVKAGFDFSREPFEVPAHRFIDHYREAVRRAGLHEEAREVLSYLSGKGYRQAVLSAMERDFLLETLADKRIMEYFEVIYGIDNHLGAGKSDLARDLIADLGCAPSATVLIGDTLHDAEVARDTGISCILIADGHQSRSRLAAAGFPVVGKLRELVGIL